MEAKLQPYIVRIHGIHNTIIIIFSNILENTDSKDTGQ